MELITTSSMAGREGRRHDFKKQEQGGCQVDSPHRRGLAERHEEETLATPMLVFSEGNDCLFSYRISVLYPTLVF